MAVASLVAGCGAPAPTAPTAPTASPGSVPSPAPLPSPSRGTAPPAAAARTGADLGLRVVLPPAPTVRSWDEFKRQAGRRMVAASPEASYLGAPPDTLFGIPILEVELRADGSVRAVHVTRRPSNPDAADTVDLAIEAVHRGAPYGDVSKLPKPWKWTEVFLFNDQRQFKPRSLE
jgi:hypothetical protein